MNHIFKATLLVAFFLIASATTTTPANAGTPAKTTVGSLRLSPQLEVEIKEHVEAILAWDHLSGTGQYLVGVYDVTDSVRFTSFNTTGLKAVVDGLTPGHTYRFTVSRGVTTLVAVVVA